ncbi:hypothetical protein [Anaerosacchariphilus polymeriproducens]|uniref:Uncharacterized protein n=1 Tax=Anaerosacchariphilus polymeriproducens TaxID=1812858 RepID=A0A371AVF5_9FIRM|nr:hypothetical protein [Anaerosacchariphilus polymeriproducens]RDU23521.1 hypothetical protein DWV06_09200 [Anaerosacchariphilus polymeriproducens]
MYYDKEKMPVFIYLLGLKDDLKDCEVAILKYDEYQKVQDNQSITIGVEKGKNNFLLFRPGSRARDLAWLWGC